MLINTIYKYKRTASICLAVLSVLFLFGCGQTDQTPSGDSGDEDIYVCDGHISELNYPLNEEMLDHAAERFEYIYDNYLSDGNNIYFSIIPDKNYFLAGPNGYPSLDYNELVSVMRESTDDYMQYIDIFDLLTLDDYYRTDSHWKQENLQKVADRIAGEMGVSLSQEYQLNELDIPFRGSYYDRTDHTLDPDTILYLTNEVLGSCTVTSYATGEPAESYLYDMEKALGDTPYSFFLSGVDPMIVLENPNALSDRELIIFRDSFASSIVPLLAEGYSKITLVDIRYIKSWLLDDYIEFEDQDVLFLYSTLLLNNSLALQ